MKEYRNRVNAQHAPQELIDRTIQYIHEADKATDEQSILGEEFIVRRKKIAGRVAAVTVAMVCIVTCLILFVGLSKQYRFYYNAVSDSMFRSGLAGQYSEELSIQDYEEYLGVKLTDLLEQYELINCKIYVRLDDENGNIVEDEGTFYLETDEQVVILKVSKSGLEVPDALRSGLSTDINDTTVYIGENVQAQQLLAVFYREKVEYYLICNDMSKKQFEKLLKHMF